MELCFDNSLDPRYDGLERTYASLMEVAFRHLGVKENYEVDVSLVNEKQIREINRDYRNIDRVTDVISFAFNDDDSDLGRIQGDVPRILGEVFICVPRALEQAKEIGNTDERELQFLFVHGLLHLLGYDHMKKEDEDVMFPLQEEILRIHKEENP
ncbi:MAG: rRNA maturation RNase YbeY [Bacilli bacterium]|nr:rRNA maturation RNase YbeY [Bacilli bacterium]